MGEGKDTHIRLGKYETEVRAKEVLREIIVEYSKYMKLRGGQSFINDSVIQPNIFITPKVYEMPER